MDSADLGDSVAVQLDTQIDRVRATGAALLGDIDSTSVGIRAGLYWSGISLFASYNRLLAGSSTAIGGDPYYSSLQYCSFADLNSANSIGVAAGISYTAESIPFEVDLAMARYRGGKVNTL